MKQASEETSALFKKLILATHPDKCSERWAETITKWIVQLYEKNDYERMKELDQYWESYHSFADYTPDEPNLVFSYMQEGQWNLMTKKQKEEAIKHIESSIWYIWYKSPDHYIHEIFLPKSVIEQKQKEKMEKMQKENEYLDRENSRLRSVIELMEDKIEKKKSKIRNVQGSIDEMYEKIKTIQ